MNILLIGNDGRSSALEWALHKSVFVKSIKRVPGSMDMSECVWCDSLTHTGKALLSRFAGVKEIDFVVIGPEAPLVAGVADVYRRFGKVVFGPSKRAAELEGSKVAAKLFCRAYDIPTADFDSAETPEQAKAYIRKRDVPVVVKADGLAGGKGVQVAKMLEEAYTAIDTFSKLPAGRRLVIEERLIGWECSYIVLTDGVNFVPLAAVRDYKTTYAGSMVNTGGMGCATLPSHLFTPALEQQIQKTILVPTLTALRNEGRPFTGALYLGLMIEGGRPYVLEFNCRFGDPETQTVLPLLGEGHDLFPFLYATTNGTMSYRLSPFTPYNPRHSVCGVLAAAGYPQQPRSGDVIIGLEEARHMENVYIFDAGTSRTPDGITLTKGGRVLNVVGTGKTLESARQNAYKAAHKIHFDGMWYREDIGL